MQRCRIRITWENSGKVSVASRSAQKLLNTKKLGTLSTSLTSRFGFSCVFSVLPKQDPRFVDVQPEPHSGYPTSSNLNDHRWWNLVASHVVAEFSNP
jgi:hypothetical protein